MKMDEYTRGWYNYSSGRGIEQGTLDGDRKTAFQKQSIDWKKFYQKEKAKRKKWIAKKKRQKMIAWIKKVVCFWRRSK